MASAPVGILARWRSRALWILPLFGVCAGGTVAELSLRIGHFTPARQIIRGNNVREFQGTAVWESTVDREHRDCAAAHPERLRILFFGNSITNGAGVLSKESFPWLLEDRLNAARPTPGFCVMNFAVPGFRFAQKYALVREMVPRYKPAAVLYQDWDQEWGGTAGGEVDHEGDYPREYVKLGDAVFGTMGLHLRPDGFPGLVGVPDWLNRSLFLHSYLYQYLTMAKGEQGRPAPRPPGDGNADIDLRLASLSKVIALVRSAGAKPAVYLVADLSYPMNETRSAEVMAEQPVLALGQTSGAPVFRLREFLKDQDNNAIRLDDWHFNPAGHRVLAERFEHIVLNLLDGVAVVPPSPPGSPPH